MYNAIYNILYTNYRNGIASMEKFDDQFQESRAHGRLPPVQSSNLKYVIEEGCYVAQGLGRRRRTFGQGSNPANIYGVCKNRYEIMNIIIVYFMK